MLLSLLGIVDKNGVVSLLKVFAPIHPGIKNPGLSWMSSVKNLDIIGLGRPTHSSSFLFGASDDRGPGRSSRVAFLGQQL